MANTTYLDLIKPLGTDHALVAQINSNSDKIDAEAGKVRANFAAPYSASSAYAVGELCTKDGKLYECNTPIGSGGEAWTAGHWTQKSVGEVTNALSQAIAGLNGRFINLGNVSGTNLSDFCKNAAVAYKALNISDTPSPVRVAWQNHNNYVGVMVATANWVKFNFSTDDDFVYGNYAISSQTVTINTTGWTKLTGVAENTAYAVPSQYTEIIAECSFSSGQRIMFDMCKPTDKSLRQDSGFYYNSATNAGGAMSWDVSNNKITIYSPLFGGTQTSFSDINVYAR